VRDGKLILAPLAANPSFDLDELIAQITDDNHYEEIGTGPATGASPGHGD
jgi:antitoxin component of MazEF toxin-antitoxin module